MTNSTPAGTMSLDWRAILAGVAPVAWYVAMAILATLGGYPGVVCITPMAWLIGLAAGQRTATVTRSAPPRRPLVEAAIAGALVGLVTGAVFAAIAPQFELRDAQEVRQMVAWTACVVVGGVPVSAALAVATAWLVTRRRVREEEH